MTIIKHELKRNSKTLFIWSILLGGGIFLFMLLYPSLKESLAQMADSYANMGSFTEAFGMNKIGMDNAMGFYGIEAGAMLSIGGTMFAAIIGIGILAKEEGQHSAEFLLTHPVSRKRIVTEKLIFSILQILFLNLICFGLASLSFVIISEPIIWKDLILYHTAQLIMQLEIGAVCFALSAFMKKNNMGLGIGIAILLYFMNIFINTSDKVNFLKYITPFQYSDAAEIFSTGHLDWVLIGIGMIVSVVSIFIAYIYYIKKDIAS